MSEIIPLFTSHYSIGSSILTLEKADKSGKRIGHPDSIIDIALKHKLKEIYLVESSLSGFVEALENTKATGIKLIFGLRIVVTQDLTQKNEESLSKNHKVIIFCKNQSGWNRLMKIYTQSHLEGKYYTNRTDFNYLNKIWDKDDLQMCIPFFDSFIFENTLRLGSCVPDFSKIKPTFFIEDHSFPFTNLLKENIIKYAESYNFPTLDTNTCYYYKNEDFLPWQVFKTIKERSCLEKPELENCSENTFSFEHYLNRIGRNINE